MATAPFHAPPPLRPGEYLAMRRAAAGLSVDEVALIFAPSREDAAQIRDALVALEADAPAAEHGWVALLPNAYPFDPTVYEALVTLAADPEAEGPHPHLCRACACSWHDSCESRAKGLCAWSEADGDLCTACERRPATAPDRPRLELVK